MPDRAALADLPTMPWVLALATVAGFAQLFSP